MFTRFILLSCAAFLGSVCGGATSPQAMGQPSCSDVDVERFKPPLDGRRDDGPAFSAARQRACAGTTINVPPGIFHPLSAVVGGPLGAIVWNLEGVAYDAAQDVPVTGIDHDLVENIFKGGTRFFGRGADASPGVGPILRVDRLYDYAGGKVGVTPALQTNCDIKNAPANYVWCNQTIVTSRAYGQGQHLAVSGSIFRPADALADGNGPRAQTWSGYFENNDQTGKSSDEAGAQVGIENDIANNGPDEKGYRILLQMNVGKSKPDGSPAAVGHGVLIGSTDRSSSIGKGFEISAPFYEAAFDASGARALNHAPAFRMSQGQRFCFDSINQHCLVYADGRLAFLAGTSAELELVDHGGTRIAAYAKDPETTASAAGTLYFNQSRHALRIFDGRHWRFLAPQPGTPSSSKSPCTPGDRMFDAKFMYLCVDADRWRRAALEEF